MGSKKNKTYYTYYVYYNIVDNTYCIDNKESHDEIHKNFVNIGKIELTQEENNKIKASIKVGVHIEKGNKEAQKIIRDKVEGCIVFDEVQKVIAQLCYNFKANEDYKYDFKKEEKKEIEIEEKKIEIYPVEYKKFEELCSNLLEIINNPLFKSEESNIKFLINYTVGLEKIIINEIIKIDENKEKTYGLLKYFSERLFDIYDKIKETKNYGKVIYINCLFSIYNKILESRNINKKINYSADYAYFFKNNVIKKILNKEKQEHFHVYEIVDKKMENPNKGENFDKNYYIVKSKEELLKATDLNKYNYIREIYLDKKYEEDYNKMPDFGVLNSFFSYFRTGATNPFGEGVKVKKFIPKKHNNIKNLPYYELITRPKVDKAIEEEIKKIEEAARKAVEEERKIKEEEERKKAEEEAKKKAKEEAERKAKEEAERKAKEEAERKAKEEAAKKAEEERKRKEEEERKKAEEAARKEVEDEEERKKKDEEAARKAAEEETKNKAEEETKNKAEEETKNKAGEEKGEETEQQITTLSSPKPQISINKNDGIIEKIIRYLPPKDKIKTKDTDSKGLLEEINRDIYNLQINEMVDDEEKKCSEETRKSKKEIIEEIKKDKENKINEGCLKKETEYTIEAFRRKYTGQKEYEYEKEYTKDGQVKIKIKNYFGDGKVLEMITLKPLQTLENLAKDIIDGKLKQDKSDIIEEQDGKYIYKNIYEKKAMSNLEMLKKPKGKSSPFQRC